MNPYVYVLSVNGVLLLFSVIFFFFPPKKINSLYGYRTYRSMKNQDVWQFSNQQFNTAFIKYATIGFVAALVLALIGSGKNTWQPMVIVLFSILATILKTEQRLNKHFDKEGTRKKSKK
ncbi:MAG: SdpI family protein [Flavobacteriaceae bacterium]|nr:SdpI family protein [Flavobacteriaceae bacterium]